MQALADAAPGPGEDSDDDDSLGALIYRESETAKARRRLEEVGTEPGDGRRASIAGIAVPGGPAEPSGSGDVVRRGTEEGRGEGRSSEEERRTAAAARRELGDSAWPWGDSPLLSPHALMQVFGKPDEAIRHEIDDMSRLLLELGGATEPAGRIGGDGQEEEGKEDKEEKKASPEKALSLMPHQRGDEVAAALAGRDHSCVIQAAPDEALSGPAAATPCPDEVNEARRPVGQIGGAEEAKEEEEESQMNPDEAFSSESDRPRDEVAAAVESVNVSILMIPPAPTTQADEGALAAEGGGSKTNSHSRFSGHSKHEGSLASTGDRADEGTDERALGTRGWGPTCSMPPKAKERSCHERTDDKGTLRADIPGYDYFCLMRDAHAAWERHLATMLPLDVQAPPPASMGGQKRRLRGDADKAETPEAKRARIWTSTVCPAPATPKETHRGPPDPRVSPDHIESPVGVEGDGGPGKMTPPAPPPSPEARTIAYGVGGSNYRGSIAANFERRHDTRMTAKVRRLQADWGLTPEASAERTMATAALRVDHILHTLRRSALEGRGREDRPPAPSCPPRRAPYAPPPPSDPSERASPSPSTVGKRRKTKGPQVIDGSAVAPTDEDVLFDFRGTALTHHHPGNVKFDARALELSRQYARPTTTNGEKLRLLTVLVESVRGRGHRFLQQGPDGPWREVMGYRARRMASLVLRRYARQRLQQTKEEESRLSDQGSDGATAPPSPSTASKQRKKKSPRGVIHESVAVTPTDDDVLFGKGCIHRHPGNVMFHAMALELSPLYERPLITKEEKCLISTMLVQSVRRRGNRFLERGPGRSWHEVTMSKARRKAARALRDAIQRQRQTKEEESRILDKMGQVTPVLGTGVAD